MQYLAIVAGCIIGELINHYVIDKMISRKRSEEKQD